MDEMVLLKKLSAVEAIAKVPRDVSNAIKRINDVRNAVAHSLFPENRRRYMADKRVLYKGDELTSAWEHDASRKVQARNAKEQETGTYEEEEEGS
jgi:hypothetical protein